MPTEVTRSARVEARISPEALSIVRRAAELQGRSVSDFIVAAAQEAAQKTVAEVEMLAQQHIVSMLLNPPAPTAALERAFARHRARVVE